MKATIELWRASPDRLYTLRCGCVVRRLGSIPNYGEHVEASSRCTSPVCYVFDANALADKYNVTLCGYGEGTLVSPSEVLVDYDPIVDALG